MSAIYKLISCEYFSINRVFFSTIGRNRLECHPKELLLVQHDNYNDNDNDDDDDDAYFHFFS